MKRLPFARWTQRLNLAQRMSIAFCTIVLVVLIALVASFSAFYSNQVEKAVNENISQVAVINAKTISSQFERMEIFLDALSSRSSGLHEVLLAYDGTLASCIATFESAKALVAQYADVAIQPITYQYHASLFVNPAYPLSGRLSEIYMDRAPIGGTWVFADTNVREEDWFQLAAASPNTNVWFARMENPAPSMSRGASNTTRMSMSKSNWFRLVPCSSKSAALGSRNRWIFLPWQATRFSFSRISKAISSIRRTRKTKESPSNP